MVSIELTIKRFGYSPESLPTWSHYMVIRVCDGCGKVKELRLCKANTLCLPCTSRKRALELSAQGLTVSGRPTGRKDLTASQRRASMKSIIRWRTAMREAKNKPCADCGVQYPYWVMQFDHRNPEEKLFTIASVQHSVKVLMEEVAKCDVVCANCHADRTYWQRQKKLDRGGSAQPVGS